LPLIFINLKDKNEVKSQNHLPHIHVRYQGEEASISIDDGSIFEGTLPRKQLKMV
jgi:hypothetical protein